MTFSELVGSMTMMSRREEEGKSCESGDNETWGMWEKCVEPIEETDKSCEEAIAG